MDPPADAERCPCALRQTAGQPTYLAGGAGQAQLMLASAAMVVGLTITSLAAAPELLLWRIFLVDSVSIAMAAPSITGKAERR